MKLTTILNQIFEASFFGPDSDYNTKHSDAAKQAHALGLKYKGHGYWMDENGETVAQTIKGQLVKINSSVNPTEKNSVYMSHASKSHPTELNAVPLQSWADAPAPPQKERPKYPDPKKEKVDWKAIKQAEEAEALKWKGVAGTNPNLQEPELDSAGLNQGAGVIVMEPDGRVWIVEPTNHYGQYEHTFPKGTLETGLSLQETAIKEAYEESGLQVQITGLLGDFVRSQSVGRYYLAQRVGGTPTDHGWETNSVKLVPLSRLDQYLNRDEDIEILEALKSHTADPQNYVPKPVDHEKIKQMKERWKKEEEERKKKAEEKKKSQHHNDHTQDDYWSQFHKKQKEKDDTQYQYSFWKKPKHYQ